MNLEKTAVMRFFNASILVMVDGKSIDSYGVFLDDFGKAMRCSEHGATPDPVAWLSKRYPKSSFVLVEDNGDAYYADLKKALGF